MRRTTPVKRNSFRSPSRPQTRAAQNKLHPTSLAQLREIATLLAQLIRLDRPLDDPAGLAAALKIVLALAQALGLSESLLARLKSAAENPFLLQFLITLIRLAKKA